MLSRRRWFALSATAAATLTLTFTASPANAIVGGTDDTSNVYQNVGMLQLRIEDDWFAFCSGTLVAENVVLTAAH